MKNLSKTEKENIVKRCLSGEGITVLANEYGISRGSIYNWINEFKMQKKVKVNIGEFRKLSQKCEKLEKIIKLLQESPFINEVPHSELLPYLEQLNKKNENIHVICEAFCVPRGTFYNYILRGKHGNTKAVQNRAELLPLIKKIYSESDHIYGAGKIAAILNNSGHKVSDRLVASIMHENGMFSIRGGSKKMYMQRMRDNIIKQHFKTTHPNEIWVSDVTYFKLKNKQYYICVIIDLFSRKVVGYNISLKNNTSLTKRMVREAYADRATKDGLIFHSDNGSNYISNIFTSFLSELKIVQSFSKAGVPYDNSVCESFFKNMKTEELYRKDYTSEKHFRKSVNDYIRFYNHDRPHTANINCTPDQKEAQYFANHLDDQ